MATYKQIQDYVKERHGCTVKTCWIAHVKELNGLKLHRAPNREAGDKRKNPCPPSKRLLIEEAMRHYGMI
ncbi:MAG: hypothetical protein H8D43_03100 [Chloroflexi bacterium]|nr:hypothetical protein [Chloroflexota bacterium]